MAISNHERVGRALNLLHAGLYPFVEREMQAVYGDSWLEMAASKLPEGYLSQKKIEDVLQTDISALLILAWEEWKEVFGKTLGRSERTLVSELRDTRNAWAHTNTFSTDDAYRALDSIERLLKAVSAPQAAQIEKQKQELLRIKFEEQARSVARRSTTAPIEGQPMSGLKPWREIATPHPDVASGRFQQAEFAADLWQVYLDEGSDEYRDPTEFYRRTYLTDGLKQLLINALKRLSGQGGDPVIELQTNFGGGKTHAMLALYHLCKAHQISDLPGMEPIFQQVGIDTPPQNVNVAVLVGNKLQPSGIVPYKPEHSRQHRPLIKTLWGELAWQLGGAEGYELVRSADETSTNPGDALKSLFNRFSPCLILIDEWVSYARQLHEQSDLAGGSFDTQFTFAQTLSESAKNAKDTLLVVSIPSSDIEIGGDRGKEALHRLKNAIGRVESPWRPASAEESFEIVRRRLFQPITDPSLFAQRDAVVKAFMDLYRNQSQEFPSECKQSDYERRMKAAYPIHPELFDRLYTDWSTLDKFQRTRGVLRLMAQVIRCLWEREDRSLLIMPAHIPMDDQQVQLELTHYLGDNWQPVIDKDVDGDNSLPLTLDRSNHNLGRYSACRRVARTVYLGSAPTLNAANRGIDERRVKLGCVQPGEQPAIFGDALRRLTDQATYLYVDEARRYWISTQPNINRTAQERAEQILGDRHRVWSEIIQRLKRDRNRGEFSAVHIAPSSSADIPDNLSLGVRLVVLAPDQVHSKGHPDSPARQWVQDALEHRGSSPRYYQNTLLFLAVDQSKVENLERNTAQYLAWQAIVNEKEILNLDASQATQANTKLQESNRDVDNSLRDSYQWLLIPTQPEAQGGLEWKEIRLQGQDPPILQASRKAVQEGDLSCKYAATNLKLEVLDRYLWRDTPHVALQSIWEDLNKYLYLPRLKDQSIFLDAVSQGVSEGIFAYAEGFDEQQRKYVGLEFQRSIKPQISGLLVKPQTAEQQLATRDTQPQATYPEAHATTAAQAAFSREPSSSFGVPQHPSIHRFYGSVTLDPLRINQHIPTIVEAVVQPLTSLVDVKVTVRLEIEAEGNQIPTATVRTVKENCQTLKFETHEFE